MELFDLSYRDTTLSDDKRRQLNDQVFEIMESEIDNIMGKVGYIYFLMCKSCF